MSKRLQIILNENTFSLIESTHKQICDGHPQVKLNFSDLINEMISCSKININDIRSKHTDIRRTLIELAKQKDLKVEEVIQQLAQLKTFTVKKELKKLSKSEQDVEGNE